MPCIRRIDSMGGENGGPVSNPPAKELSFADFSRLAVTTGISKYERIGFPDSYRSGYEPAIFTDILAKLDRLSGTGLNVLDIGPGCSELPHLIIGYCAEHKHRLLLVDSKEMLAHLPDQPFIEKHIGPYPSANRGLERYAGNVDIIICYSVFHYIFAEGNVFEFLDFSLHLLGPGGAMLIGDIPNQSMRDRFFSSDAGRAFHRQFTGVDAEPPLGSYAAGKPDDAVLFAMVARARNAGFHAYVLPQSHGLPMANRREDILIRRP